MRRRKSRDVYRCAGDQPCSGRHLACPRDRGTRHTPSRRGSLRPERVALRCPPAGPYPANTRRSNQSQDVGARILGAAAITGPADSIGYPTTFVVDSIVADSGTPPPIVDNVNKVRKLVFAGRVAPRGEFVNALASDSAQAQSVVQLLGNFRDFLPRLPIDGLKPGAAWTDTVEASQKGSGSEVSRRTI